MERTAIIVGTKVGTIIHFFPRISVAEVKVTDTLKVGDTIKILGKKTDHTQTVESMEINHAKVNEANQGDDIGLKVDRKIPEGCCVYKL